MNRNLFFTSDHHFGHANIIKYCQRPFANSQEMDTEMVRRWNVRVSDLDTVYHLGDFTLRDYHQAARYFSQLNGTIKVLGNVWHHDKRWIQGRFGRAPLKSASDAPVDIIAPITVLEFRELGKKHHPLALTLCHYPLAEWDRKHHGGWHLHGHSHGKHNPHGFIFDAGVDNNSFCPISLEDVIDEMEKRGWEK